MAPDNPRYVKEPTTPQTVNFVPDNVPTVRYSTVGIIWQQFRDKGQEEYDAVEATAKHFGVAPFQVGSILESLKLMKWWVE